MSSANSYVDLLIIGAGPAGLAAACWAAQYDISIRIIDQKAGRTKTGHADGIQSRTLEILDSFGIVDPILKQGTPEVDMCYWEMNSNTGNIERRGRDEADIGRMSRFGQILLNQGAIEQNFIDHLYATKNRHVEWNKRAETLHLAAVSDNDDKQAFPVVVGVACLEVRGSPQEVSEKIHARYLMSCDGAHSWVRHQLNAATEGDGESRQWGVLDIVPITDFPDIRQACSVQSGARGSIMTVPRENRLVRFYIQIQDELKGNGPHSQLSPEALVAMAERAIEPYKLTYKYCDWWSLYSTDRRIVDNYRPHKRVFLAGDAAHTHSPKGGQGLNVSIQDAYNLVWKLGAVLAEGADPAILDTYDAERRAVAKKLMELDAHLVHAYENSSHDKPEGVYEVRDRYSGFMAGVDVTYAPSGLVADGNRSGNQRLARNLKLGVRLPSYPVRYQCDGASIHLAKRLSSNGSWRLLVFLGDLSHPGKMEAVAEFAQRFVKIPHLAHLWKDSAKMRGPRVDVLLLHSGTRDTVNLLELPELFHPFDNVLGWDYWNVFVDQDSQIYTAYGIETGDRGCLVLCRPDQHVAWIGSIDNVAGLDNYFSFFSS